ncbi:MAG: hypothetical protein PHE21_02185 [Candidatus Dojkabacteria bacterium]|nr:hypothetical protein [Candidatus Dojkabacteria bacterium]
MSNNNIESKIAAGIVAGAMLTSGCSDGQEVKAESKVFPTDPPITHTQPTPFNNVEDSVTKGYRFDIKDPITIENTKEVYYPLVQGYYGITERVKDPNIIKNMHTSMEYINEYSDGHPIQSFYIEYDSLRDFLKQVMEDENLFNKGLRYNTAMNYFKDTEKWLYPTRGGIIGTGACDIATTINRAIVKNYKQEGNTEWQMGHKIEKWGPFIIISKDHKPYEDMPLDEIAVDIYNGRETFLEMAENSEFMIFFTKDNPKEPTKEIRIFLEEENNVYTSNLLVRHLDKNLPSN